MKVKNIKQLDCDLSILLHNRGFRCIHSSLGESLYGRGYPVKHSVRIVEPKHYHKSITVYIGFYKEDNKTKYEIMSTEQLDEIITKEFGPSNANNESTMRDVRKEWSQTDDVKEKKCNNRKRKGGLFNELLTIFK